MIIDEGKYHWIPGKISGDFVTDEEIAATAQWVSNYNKELQIAQERKRNVTKMDNRSKT